MKRILNYYFALAFVMATISVQADPILTITGARQHTPWDGKVDIEYSIAGVEDGYVDCEFSIEALDGASSKVYECKTFIIPPCLSNGSWVVTWDATADNCPADTTDYYFKAAVRGYPKYLIIDLTDGANAEEFPYSYSYSIPKDGWQNQHKTTSIVFRACPASPSDSVVSPFYIGIFELTKGQYTGILGYDEPGISWESGGHTVDTVVDKEFHPVNMSNWDNLSGVVVALNNKLQGISTCLPTSSQWKFAAMGGVNSLMIDSNMGRFYDSLSDGAGDGSGRRRYWLDARKWHSLLLGDAPVGSYAPNAWGIYDMYGNVWEWTGDIFAYQGYANNGRRMIGGGWMDRVTGNANVIDISISLASNASRLDNNKWNGSIDKWNQVSNLEANYITGYGGRLAINASENMQEKAVEAQSDALELAKEIKRVEILPESCSFDNASIEVSIGCETEGVKIYYTIDGSAPSELNGILYSGPFNVYQSASVKAIAVRNGWLSSDVATCEYLRKDAIGEAANLLTYTMVNDVDFPWCVDSTVSHDGISSAKSGSILHGGVSGIKTQVKSAGLVSFWWRAKCEEPDIDEEGLMYYDYGAFLVDNEVKARIAGNDTGWQYVKIEVPTSGKHTLRWEYRKDEETTFMPDCVWVDRVQWIPSNESGHTVTTPVPVPYSWLSHFGLGMTTDFEEAANSWLGKTSDGKQLHVWQDYVAGTIPTNADSVFTAKIDMVDGVANITWEPDLNEGGTKDIRIYKIWGKQFLDDAEWSYPTDSLHRFFRVSVELK